MKTLDPYCEGGDRRGAADPVHHRRRRSLFPRESHERTASQDEARHAAGLSRNALSAGRAATRSAAKRCAGLAKLDNKRELRVLHRRDPNGSTAEGRQRNENVIFDLVRLLTGRSAGGTDAAPAAELEKLATSRPSSRSSARSASWR